MEDNFEQINSFDREIEFLYQLRSNQVSIPNVFTVEMGKIIKKAREENGMSQTELAEKISRKQTTVSDIEKGKIEIGILTLVLISLEFRKPISYFIPQMKTISAHLNDIQDKDEEEVLIAFRELSNIGQGNFAKEYLNFLLDYTIKEQKEQKIQKNF